MRNIFPTLDTLQETFYGVPFEDVPICCVRCSKNNTLITVTDKKGVPIMHTSCGAEGYKNCKKKTEVAGQATGIAAAVKAARRGIKTVRVVVKGLGPGRLSAVRGMAAGGLNIVSITDATPLPELGPRPRKERKV